jgi:hypothetical protein
MKGKRREENDDARMFGMSSRALRYVSVHALTFTLYYPPPSHSSAELPSLISPHEVVGSRATCDPVATALAKDWVTMSLLFAQW